MKTQKQIKKFLKQLGYNPLYLKEHVGLEAFLSLVDSILALTRMERENWENSLNGGI